MSYGTSALPPIDQASLPAEIRKASPQEKQDYQAALGFERVLLGELAKAMADTAKPAGEESGEPEDAATSMYMQMLPDQLADSISSGGGLGLAQSFYDTMKERA